MQLTLANLPSPHSCTLWETGRMGAEMANHPVCVGTTAFWGSAGAVRFPSPGKGAAEIN